MKDSPESLLAYAEECDAIMRRLPPGDPARERTLRELDWALNAAAEAENGGCP